MSHKKQTFDGVEILSRYATGFFPLYDEKGKFYWERLGVRAVVPVTEEARGRARRMARRAAGKFQMRDTTAVEEVIAQLQREEVKERSWVKKEVVGIYRVLHEAGLLRTVEAWRGGRLVGGVLGLVLPGTFVAETMFGVEDDASKVCLCRLVEMCGEKGFAMIDVQTPHDVDEWGLPRGMEGETPHPCMRLGEERVPIGVYMRAFVVAWRRAFAGGVEEWLALGKVVKSGRVGAEVMAEHGGAVRMLMREGGGV